MAVQRFQAIGAPASSSGHFTGRTYTDGTFSYVLVPDNEWQHGYYTATLTQFSAVQLPPPPPPPTIWYGIDMTVSLIFHAPPSPHVWNAGIYTLKIWHAGGYQPTSGEWLLTYSMTDGQPNYPARADWSGNDGGPAGGQPTTTSCEPTTAVVPIGSLKGTRGG